MINNHDSWNKDDLNISNIINNEDMLDMSYVTDEELKEDYIIPSPFDKRVCSVVAKEVGRVAREQGIARI